MPGEITAPGSIRKRCWRRSSSSRSTARRRRSISLDLRALAGFADYFLICSGRSDRQCKAIHDAIQLGMKTEHGMLPSRVEGLPEGRWILIDYLDVVVHVFTPETREHYRLEQLWGEAPAKRIEPVTVDA